MRINYIKNIETLLMKPGRLVKYTILLITIFSFSNGFSQCHTNGNTYNGTTVVITMTDSYGDGWDGAELEVCQNGSTTNHTISSGSSHTVILNLDVNDTYSIHYNTGSYETEHSYTVSVDGSVEYSSGIEPDAGDILHGQRLLTGIVAGSLSGSSFTKCLGSAGGERSFSVEGGSLTGNLTVTPPSGYEVSLTSGSGFNSSSITLTQSGGSVSTTVYARLTSAASNGASGNIAISGGGATTVNVATGSGVVNSLPSVSAGSDVPYSLGGNIAFDATVTGNLSGSSVTLYSEDFSNDGAKGLRSGSYYAPDDGNWSMAAGGSPDHSGTDDHCQVLSSVMECRDNAGNSSNYAIFYSPVISGNYSADISFDYGASGGGSNNGIIAYYKIDGGSWVEFENQSSMGSVSMTTATESNVSFSNSFQVKFHIWTRDYSYAYTYLDNISITGTQSATYSWTGPNSYSSTDIDPTVSASATAAMIGDYTLLVTDINGCQASDIASVTSDPTILTSASFSTFTSCSGSAGTAQSFTVSGSNLTNDIVVTAPTGYEVSKTSGSGFATSVTYTQSSGSVASSSVYVRLSSSASNGASGNISCTSTGATTVNEATGSGSVLSAPTVTAPSDVNLIPGNSISFDATVSGSLSSDIFTEANSETANYGTSESTLNDPNWSGTGWKGESDGTASSSTGPSGPQSGDDYMYLETTTYYSSTYYLTSSSISSSNVNISFYYHMYGSAVGTFKLQSYDGSSWTDRWSVTGQQHSSSADSWTNVSLDLSAYTVTKLRFSAAPSSSVSGDIAVDNINVTTGSIYAWTTDASNGTTGWSATNTEDITVTSSADATHAGDYTLTVTDINGCQNSDVVAVNTNPVIYTTGSFSSFNGCTTSAGTEQSFTIAGYYLTANLVVTAPTGYEVSKTSGSGFGSSISYTPSSGNVATTTVYVRMVSGASNGANGNVACTSTGATTVNLATGSGTVNTGPSVAAPSDVNLIPGNSISFDATVSGSLSSDIFTEANSETANYGTSESTLNDPNWSGTGWKGESDGTASSSTGPSGPQSGDDYMYLETTTYYSSTYYLTSSSISSSNVNISFYYHMYGSAVGTFKLQSYDGSSWTDRWSVTGQQHSSSADSWTNVSLDLSAYTVTKLRFSADPSSSVSGDIAVDNINVTKGSIYAWTTDASNGTTGWSATDTEDITVTSSADATHVGNYTLTVTDVNGCQNSDITVVNPQNQWTGAVSTAWTNTGNWSNGTVPTSSESLIISNVTSQPVISSSVTLAGLTIESGADITVSSNSLTVTGTTDLNGTMNIDNATVNADGTFDATGGTVDFTNANGKLILSSTVTSLGTLDDAMGTVEYDGSTQNVLADVYNNLEIDQSGTKTAAGNLDIDGNLTTSATATCKLDMSTYDLNLAGNITIGATDGLDVSDASCLVTIDGSADQSITHSGNTSSTTDSGSNLYDKYIPDESYTESDITLSSSLNATDLKSVTVNIAHNWIEDVDIRLYSPNNDYIDLSSDNGGSNEDYTNTVFETGATPITAGAAPFTGTFAPEQAFSTLSGTANGTWTLRVYDDSDLVSGTLLDWSITVEASNAVASELTNCTINKSGGDVDLASAIDIDGTLTLTAGYIDASSNAITFLDGASTSGASAASHVKGTINYSSESTTAFTFPIGNGSDYEPFTVTPNSTSANTWQLTYSATDHGDRNMGTGMAEVSQSEYWDLSRTAGSNGVTIAFNWDANDNVSTYTDLEIGHFTGGQWEVVASTPVGTNTSGTITSDAVVTSFSPFAKGSSSSGNLLPVDLLSFEAECQDNGVELTWVTASEENNDYFILEKSQDTQDYEEIAQVMGSGTSTIMNEYGHFDYASVDNQLYYRLSQVDFDGQSEMFKPISVNCNAVEGKPQLSIAGNKMNGSIKIQSTVSKNQFYDLSVFDASGKQVYTGQGFTESGEIDDQLFIYTQATGIYIVQMVVDGQLYSEKLVW